MCFACLAKVKRRACSTVGTAFQCPVPDWSLVGVFHANSHNPKASSLRLNLDGQFPPLMQRTKLLQKEGGDSDIIRHSKR